MESASTWNFGRIRGGAGSNVVAGSAEGGAAGAAAGGNAAGIDGRAAGGSDGGVAGGADGGAAGGGAAGDPPPPPDQPPTDHGGAGERRMSRRQRWIKELEFANPIQIKKPKQFYGNVGKDFDTWWIFVQVYIEDQPEKITKD
jgi:hypothetical protein